jgi:hypothetical protein
VSNFGSEADIENGFRTGSADFIRELDASHPGWQQDQTRFTMRGRGRECKPTYALEREFLTYVPVHILFHWSQRGPEIEFEVSDLWE